ncbi:MAG: hypothetical protein HY236_09625, partial [Acidobacteria bacterium]|nr:hypothetical protein [Acidobacteriota bacterium]
MFQLFRSRRQTLRIFLGIIVAMIGFTMVITLIPGIYSTSISASGETVLAEVGGESITVRDAQFQLQDYIRS